MQFNSYTDNLNIEIFDIETTGLNPENDMIISASFCNEDGLGLKQYFCEDPNAEFLLITKIIDDLNSLDGIITYNGLRFDIPFVLTRAKKYGIANDVPNIKNYDIYKLLKTYWLAGKMMPSLSQKAVENAMGFSDNRIDEIDGSECISLYNNYVKTGLESIKETILLHNADDIRQLARISSNLSFMPFHQVAFETGFTLKQRANYPGASDVLINIDAITETKNGFIANGRTVSGLDNIAMCDNNINLVYDSFSGLIRLEITCMNLEDYDYIDLQELPIEINEFKDLEGFANNYLILRQNSKIKYKEVNTLVAELVRKIV